MRDLPIELPKGAYAAIATRAARIAALREARAKSDEIVIHVRVSAVRSHLGQIARDVPRLFSTRLGEIGDRTERGRFVHVFFDEESLRDEVREAGLRIVSRDGERFVLRAAPDPAETADSFAIEVGRVLRIVAGIERARLQGSPKEVVAEARARGRSTKTRGPIGRARLHRAIGWVDAAMKENCYRRVLLELALDAGAAKERVVFSLDVRRTGHVAFEGREEASFDVAFTMEPD